METPMHDLPDTPMSKLYKEHIGFILAQDLDGLLSQYAEDCVLITTLTENRQPEYVRGHDALRHFFESRIFTLDNLESTLTQWAETQKSVMMADRYGVNTVTSENTLMIIEEINARMTDSSEAKMRFYDNWYLRDGKIAIHFAGTIRYPDGTYADGTGFAEGAAPPKHEPPTDTSLGKLYREHIAFIKEKNVEGILSQYADDAILIGTLTAERKPRYVRGRAQLRDFFNGNFMGLKSLESKIDQWAEIDNGLMVVESIWFEGMDGSTAEMSFYDNWVLVDGRIAVHYAGVVRYPDGTYA